MPAVHAGFLGVPPPAVPGQASLVPSQVLLAKRSAVGGVPSLDFRSVITDAFDSYLFVIHHIEPATDNVSLFLRGSSDDGATYLAGTQYALARISNTTSVAGPVGTVFSGVSEMALASALGNAANKYLSGAVWLHRNATRRAYLNWSACWVDPPGAMVQTQGGGIITVDAINAIRFLMSSGNIANGAIECHGIRS